MHAVDTRSWLSVSDRRKESRPASALDQCGRIPERLALARSTCRHTGMTFYSKPPTGHGAYWTREAPRLLAELSSSADGLDEATAARRNTMAGKRPVGQGTVADVMRLFLRQLISPLVLILVFGAGVSAATGDRLNTTIILSIVLGSAILGFSQEYRASAAVAKLRQRLSLKATILRAGRPTEVEAARVVAGDVLLLSAGSLVPADGVVLEAKDLLVSEATLTGETFPVEKRPGTVPAETPLSGRMNCVFQGTSVRSGTARVLVLDTGAATEYGRIGAQLRILQPETDFAVGLRLFGIMLTQVMLVIVVLVLTVNVALDRPVADTLLFSVALAVGLSPELLPAIVSVTLSVGARAMARNGVIVRRLEAIENLGSMDLLCTDKTGTLTIGVAALDAAVDPDGKASARVLQLAYLNAVFETGIENPLDAAIVAAGRRAGIDTEHWHKIDEIPYDFLRRRLTIVVAGTDDPAAHLIITKGALEPVLDCCATLGSEGIRLDAASREALLRFFRRKGAEGFRVLGLAAKRGPAKGRYHHVDETELTFLGFLLLRDPAKPDAAQTVKNLRQLGVKIKVVTGDNRFVAASLALEVGLDPAALLTGAEIAHLSDEALWHRARHTDLVAEVDPQQKERIIRVLRRSGHVVGFMGDGVNDAPALHGADIGISVEEAVDVARESADIVLLRPDLDVLRRGIEDGRRTFVNTQKYIAITLSANFGNMLSMAVASLALPFLPLLAKQILLNNFLSDFPSVAISTDRVDPEATRHPPRWKIANVRRFMLVFGSVSSLFDVLTFALLRLGFGADEMTFQTGWFVVSLLTELAVVLVLRTHRNIFDSRPGMLLLWSTVAVSLAAILIPYAGPLASLFGFVPMPANLVLSLLGIVGLYLLATEVAKRRFYPDAYSATRAATPSSKIERQRNAS